MSALPIDPVRPAVLDAAHVGDIKGAFGTIRAGDIAPRTGWKARAKTLLAIIGPGLIVMVGDNDAGAFGTYTQAGQNYGTSLLWTLLLLVPVLYVNQEMVLRLGAVTGAVIAVLVTLSIILTAAVLFPDISGETIVAMLAAGVGLALVVALGGWALRATRGDVPHVIDRAGQATWRMPALDLLKPPRLSLQNKVWMSTLRFYLLLAGGLVLWRIVLLAVGDAG